MSTVNDKQYRAGFEAWARSKGYRLERYELFPEYRDGQTQVAWVIWTASKREASTEPSAGYGPVHVVGDLVRNLLRLDQAAPIYAAFHVDVDGRRRCRTRPVMTSWERVVDGKWVESSRIDVPYSVIVWAKPQADDAGAGALPDEAIDAALIEIGDRVAGALEVVTTAMRNTGSSAFVTGLIAEWRAAAQAKAGKP